MMIANIGQTNGILNPRAIAEKFQLTRHLPAQDTGYFVERYWVVRWDLCGQAPYQQETLPYAVVNMTIEHDRSRIVGVVKGKFSVLLQDQGWVFGVKFRPGAFYAFANAPVSTITDRTIRIEDVFGGEGVALEAAIRACDDEAKWVEHAEQFLRRRLPERDETIDLINRVIDCVIADRSILKVDQLAERFSLSKRTLQRIFSQYVGVSPKWVIMRYRLQEAADRMARRESLHWPQMALELGYFDQAHFINDFKMIVGRTPADYARSVGPDL
jgi:AraC-like DNA-binding protein